MKNSVTIDQALDIIRDYHSTMHMQSAVSYPHGQRFFAWSKIDGVYRIFAAGKIQLLRCPGDIFPFHEYDGHDVLLNMTRLSVQALDAWRVVGEFTHDQLLQKRLERLGL